MRSVVAPAIALALGLAAASLAEPAGPTDLRPPPRTRAVQHPDLRDAVADADWTTAETAARWAIATELTALETPPALGWETTAARVTESRIRGRWLRERHVHSFDEALARGDFVEASYLLHQAGRLGLDLSDRERQLARRDIEGRIRNLLPWISAAGFAWLGGWLLDRTARRRLRPVIPVHHNPFVAGRPLRDAAMVYGRAALLRHLGACITARCGVYVTGERRIGKTTLLLMLAEQIGRGGGVAVLIDVAGTRGDGARGAVEAAVAATARACGLPAGGDVLACLRALGGRGPVAFLLDEVDALNHATEATRRWLRQLAVEPDAAATMVAAGVGFDLTGDAEAEAWAARIETVAVGPLDDEACRALLTEPVAGRIQWSPPALAAAVEAARGRPMRAQLIGLHTVEQLEERTRVEISDVQAAVPVVDRAWAAVQEQGLDEEFIPVDVDGAMLELGRLRQEIEDLHRLLARP